MAVLGIWTAKGGCEGLARVRLFFGEPETETFSP